MHTMLEWFRSTILLFGEALWKNHRRIYRFASAPFSLLENENVPECTALKAALRREIEALCDLGVTKFLTGVTIGVDMWYEEIVIDLIAHGREIEMIAVVPFRDPDEKWSR